MMIDQVARTASPRRTRAARQLLIASALCLHMGASGASNAGQPAAADIPGATAPAATPINLNITPKRLTLTRGQRTASAHIFNRGDAPATFDISLVDRVMLESGEIKPAAEVAGSPSALALRSARDMIIVSPRRVTLAPGRGQTIRIRVTAPAGAAASEYRTHLTVTTLPPPGVGLTAADAAARGANQLSFRVNSVFGVSIPVIVRPQPVTAEGEIRNVRLVRAERPGPGGAAAAALMFDLARTGTASLFGNVEVRSRAQGRMGHALGLGVYAEIGQRSVSVPLQRLPASGEVLEVAFTDDDIAPGRVVARTTFRVP